MLMHFRIFVCTQDFSSTYNFQYNYTVKCMWFGNLTFSTTTTQMFWVCHLQHSSADAKNIFMYFLLHNTMPKVKLQWNMRPHSATDDTKMV